MKVAIINTLVKLIQRGGAALKPFQPQLQASFVKALGEPTQAARDAGVRALGALMPLTTRVDPLVGELVALLGGAAPGGGEEAVLGALRAVCGCGGGERLGAGARARALDAARARLSAEDPPTRARAGGAWGAALRGCAGEEAAALLRAAAATVLLPAAPASLAPGEREEVPGDAAAAVRGVPWKEGRAAAVEAALRWAPAELAAAGLLPAVGAHVLAVAGASFPGLRAAAARCAGLALAAAGGYGGPPPPPGAPPPDAAAAAAAAAAYRAALLPAAAALIVRLLGDPSGDVRASAIGAVRRAARHGLPAAQAAAAAAPALLPTLLEFVTRESPNPALRLKVDRALTYLLGARDLSLKGPPPALIALCGDATMQKFVKTYWTSVLRGQSVDAHGALHEESEEEDEGGER